MRCPDLILAGFMLCACATSAHALAVPGNTEAERIDQAQVALNARLNNRLSPPAVRKALLKQSTETLVSLESIRKGADPRLVPLNPPSTLAERWTFEKGMILGVLFGTPLCGFIFCLCFTRHAMKLRERERKAMLGRPDYLAEEPKESTTLKPKIPITQFVALRSNSASEPHSAGPPEAQPYFSLPISKPLLVKHTLVERRRRPRRKQTLLRRPGFKGLHSAVINRRPKNFVSRSKRHVKDRTLYSGFGGAAQVRSRQRQVKKVVPQFRLGGKGHGNKSSARANKIKHSSSMVC